MANNNSTSLQPTLLGIFLFGLIISGCSLQRFSETTPTLDTSYIFTQAAQTIEAQLTATADGHSSTPEASHTATASPSETALVPTPTTTLVPSTNVVPTLTPVPQACDKVQFVRDLSIEDNTPYAPQAGFTKTWRLKNVGNCTWTTDYALVFVSGDAMSDVPVQYLPINVAPNESIDISIKLTAPRNIGTYRGNWMLRNSSGTLFGIGPNGDSAFWVQIKVLALGNPSFVYDFAANVCTAEWRSASGRLACPGTSSSKDGFVILMDNPKLENRTEDELTLWTNPNNASNGWISGTFPEVTIKNGYRFKGWVGCLADSKGCNVTFRLDYVNPNGQVKNLGVWQEVFDGKVTIIDLDLSPLQGQRVRLILTTEVRGGNPERANAFWFVPSIRQGAPNPTLAAATATSTATSTNTPDPSPTATPTETPIP